MGRSPGLPAQQATFREERPWAGSGASRTARDEETRGKGCQAQPPSTPECRAGTGVGLLPRAGGLARFGQQGLFLEQRMDIVSHWSWALTQVRATGYANLGLPKKLIPEPCPQTWSQSLECVLGTHISDLQPGNSEAGNLKAVLGVWGQVGMGWVTGFYGKEWWSRAAEKELVRAKGPFLCTQETKVHEREGGLPQCVLHPPPPGSPPWDNRFF